MLILLLFLYQPVKPIMTPTAFTIWDIKYGAQTMVNQVVTKSSRNLATVLIGVLSSATVIAEFSVAVRLMQLLTIPQLALSQLQIPRVGALIKQNDFGQVAIEYSAMRGLALLGTLIGCGFYIALAPYVLNWFGDYTAAYAILLVLAGSSVLLSGFGSAGEYLLIIGHAGYGLIANIVALVALLTGIFAFVPSFGGMGAGFSVLLSTFISLILFAVFIWRVQKLSVLSWPVVTIMLASIAVLLLAALGYLSSLSAVGLFAALSGILLLWDRTAINFFLK